MASSEVRVYAVIFADFPAGSVSDASWQTLMVAAKAEPLSTAILAAAQGRGAQAYITHRKRSQNAAYLRLYTMLGFEIDRAEVDALEIVLNEQAIVYGVAGNTKAKFEGVLQGELRTAAEGIGYTPTQQSKLSVFLINDDISGTFERAIAIAQAQTYLAANAAIWYA